MQLQVNESDDGVPRFLFPAFPNSDLTRGTDRRGVNMARARHRKAQAGTYAVERQSVTTFIQIGSGSVKPCGTIVYNGSRSQYLPI